MGNNGNHQALKKLAQEIFSHAFQFSADQENTVASIRATELCKGSPGVKGFKGL